MDNIAANSGVLRKQNSESGVPHQKEEEEEKEDVHCFSSKFHLWRAEVRETVAYARHRLRKLTAKDYAMFLLFLIFVAAAQGMTFFGQNFWLARFQRGTNTYVSILLPSAAWAILILFVIGIYKGFQNPSAPLWFWVGHREGTALLVSVGVLDAFAGLTSVYAVPHVPGVIQTAINATSTLWVYIFHRLAYRETALPFSGPLALCFTLMLLSVALTIISQLRSSSDSGGSVHPAWIAVIVVSVILPALYSVFQGRFLALFPPDYNASYYSVPSRGREEEEGEETTTRTQQAAATTTTATTTITAQTPLMLADYYPSPQHLQKGGGGGSDSITTASSSSENGDDETRNKDDEGERKKRMKNILIREEGKKTGTAEGSGKGAGVKDERITSSTTTPSTAAIHIHHRSPTGGVPPAVSKLVSLAGDFVVQAVLSAALLPVDALPWFGASPSIPDAVTNFREAASCVAECDNGNAVYFVLYVMGFFCSRLIGAKLNLYSPTMSALVFAAVSPINVFIILLFPALNVNGANVSVGFTLGTFFCIATSALLYCALNEANKDVSVSFRNLRTSSRNIVHDSPSSSRRNVNISVVE